MVRRYASDTPPHASSSALKWGSRPSARARARSSRMSLPCATCSVSTSISSAVYARSAVASPSSRQSVSWRSITFSTCTT